MADGYDVSRGGCHDGTRFVGRNFWSDGRCESIPDYQQPELKIDLPKWLLGILDARGPFASKIYAESVPSTAVAVASRSPSSLNLRGK